MDDNLLGHLLNALDPQEQQRVELDLRWHAEARQGLELLRQALEPLAVDRDAPEYEPPAGLRMRTLARVAEYRCRELEPPPPAPILRLAPPATRSWWSRADVLVAASLLLIAFPLLFPVLTKLQQRRNIIECQNNLHSLYTALVNYGTHHNGQLPQVEDQPPHNFAGVMVPKLYQEGLVTPQMMFACPATGRQPTMPLSLAELQNLYDRDRGQFEQYIRDAGGCYGYPLGYREDGRLQGFQFPVGGPADGLLPILADRPPFEDPADPDLMTANSRNHGGAGQNVLRLGGQVEWCTSRHVGPNGDDIYLNQRQELDAGVDRSDVVLAASGVQVRPVGQQTPKR
jgi:hypothetical protein